MIDTFCELRHNPLGIDTPEPRFSWIITDTDDRARNQNQSAYQILVTDSDRQTLWDSGQITSPQSHSIKYAGPPLASAQQVHWKVRIWQDTNPTDWSDTATFTMGLLNPQDWQAKWITPDPAIYTEKSLPYLRHNFEITKPITRGLVFICGLGHFDFLVNGQPATENILDPGWTQYKKTCLYVTHDITQLLKDGDNTLGIILGNGMYNVIGTPGRYKKFKASFGPPKLLVQLHLDYADTTTEIITTNESWKISLSPTTFSCIFGGEDYDARLEQPNWASSDYDDRHWQKASLTEGPGGKLISQTAPPLKIIRNFAAKEIPSPDPEVKIYDIGRNLSGFPKIIAHASPGDPVKLFPGELLDSTTGRVSQKSSGSPVYFQLTPAENQETTWQPRFSYTGFRYLEAQGNIAIIKSLSAQQLHSSAKVIGHFACSNPLINKIHDLITAAIASNLQSVLTDCPHREKLGWLEQSHLMGTAVMLNYDVPNLYKKICADMRDAQQENGCVPTIAPEYVVFKDKYAHFSNSPEWGSAAILNPWLHYQQYGDKQILEDNFEMMTRYADYLHTAEEEPGIINFGLGDWYDIGPGDPGYTKLTSVSLVNTAIYYQDLTVLKQVADLLGHKTDADRYSDLSKIVRQSFNKKFYNPETAQYDKNSQTANAMPLALGMVEPPNAPRVLENLIADIRAKQNHITAGDIGFRYVIAGLANADRSDVIYDLLTRTDAPSYGDQIQKGATTLTEAWDANPKNSQNHLMLGHAELWLYQNLAGIQFDLSQSPPNQITIRPTILGDLTFAEADYHSVLGKISSKWQRDDKILKLTIQIPFNTGATVHVPTTDPNSITENKAPFAKSPGVTWKKNTPKTAVFELASGTYLIQSPYANAIHDLQK